MGFLAYRETILIVCIGFLVLQPGKVSGLGRKDLAPKWRSQLHLPFLRDLHIFKDVALEDLQRKLSLAPAPSVTFDPNQSDKRGVKRGSDPIHNRC